MLARLLLILILHSLPITLHAKPLQLPQMVTAGANHQWQDIALHQEGPFVSLSATLRIAKSFDDNDTSYPDDAGAILKISLPVHQRLRQYALDVGSDMRAAEIVEQSDPRSTFDRIVSWNNDSKSLEQRSENRYSLRVYPVKPETPRMLRFDMVALASREGCGWQISLSEELLETSGYASFTLRSQVEPTTNGFEVVRSSRDKTLWELTKQESHTEKFHVCLPAQQDLQLWSVSHANTVMRFLEVNKNKFLDAAHQFSPPKHIQLIWDNSFSQQYRLLENELSLLRSYLAGRDVRLTVTTLDVVGNQQRNFNITNGASSEVEWYLRSLVPDGASALNKWSPEKTADVVLVFSDGLPPSSTRRICGCATALTEQPAACVPNVGAAIMKRTASLQRCSKISEQCICHPCAIQRPD